MSKKVKRKIWACIFVIAGIVAFLFATVCRYYARQENIFFLEYESEYEKDDTIIYLYNSKNNTVDEIGRVQGKLQNCVINSDETYITGVIYDGVFEIVRYDLVSGAAETLDAAEKISALTDNHAGWANTLIYNGGDKIFVHYKDKNEDIKWLFYDLNTGQYDIVEGESVRSLTIHNDNLWYIASGTLYQYDLESTEKIKIMESVYYDSAIMPETGLVAYTKDATIKEIYLYDMRTQKSSSMVRGGWNTYYGDLFWTKSRWSDNGREFFYIKSFQGLFNASTEQLMVYDVLTHRSRCIYKVKMTLHEFQYVMKR